MSNTILLREVLFSMVTIPHGPRGLSAAEQIFEVLLFLERIHARPIALMGIGHQFAFANETLERRLDQLLTIVNVTENLLPKNHESTVNPGARFPDMLNARHYSALAPYRSDGSSREALHSQSRLYSRCS